MFVSSYRGIGRDNLRNTLRMVDYVARPYTESGMFVHCPHPFGQELSLAAVFLGVLPLDLKHEANAVSQADQKIRKTGAYQERCRAFSTT